MPFNPSPEVAVAREAASKLKAKAAIVIYVSEDGEKIGMASYGQDAKTCRAAAELGDWLYESARQHVVRSRRAGDERI
jgi:hypothetical protein